jgi:hypothetical protein
MERSSELHHREAIGSASRLERARAVTGGLY